MRLLLVLAFIGAVFGFVIPQEVIDFNVTLSESDFHTTNIVDPSTVYLAGTQQSAGHIRLRSGRRLFFWSVLSWRKTLDLLLNDRQVLTQQE